MKKETNEVIVAGLSCRIKDDMDINHIIKTILNQNPGWKLSDNIIHFKPFGVNLILIKENKNETRN